MGIWSALRKGLGATEESAAERARQDLPTFEQLEPRVLLSADPLGLAGNDYYGDDDLAEPAIVIEFDPTEPSGDHEPAGDQPLEASPDEPTTDSLDRAAPDKQSISDNPFGPSLSEVADAVTLPATHLTDEHTLTETASPSGDGVDISSQLDPFIPDVRAAGISEARAPPDGSDSGSTHSLYSPYSTSDDGFSSSRVEAVPLQSVPTLPGLRLVDPHTDFQRQVVYLDFDGAQDVIYSGPVTVGPFDVPTFTLAGTDLAGREQVVISEILLELEEIFAESGVVFTAERPAEGSEYSTVFVGGDDSGFAEYGTGKPAVVTDPANIVSLVDIFFQDFESGLGPNETLLRWIHDQ